MLPVEGGWGRALGLIDTMLLPVLLAVLSHCWRCFAGFQGMEEGGEEMYRGQQSASRDMALVLEEALEGVHIRCGKEEVLVVEHSRLMEEGQNVERRDCSKRR